jgi:hypothetical protein
MIICAGGDPAEVLWPRDTRAHTMPGQADVPEALGIETVRRSTEGQNGLVRVGASLAAHATKDQATCWCVLWFTSLALQ